MIADSFRRYPLMQLKAALYDSVLQFFMFRTGDGIESQARILTPELSHDTPGQLARLSATPASSARVIRFFEDLKAIRN